MGVALVPQAVASGQVDVVVRDDAVCGVAVSGQAPGKVVPQVIVHLAGCHLYGRKAEAARRPAVEKGAGQCPRARPCIQEAAGVQGAGWKKGRHEAGHGCRRHELAKLGFPRSRLVFLRDDGCLLLARGVCKVQSEHPKSPLQQNNTKSSYANRQQCLACYSPCSSCSFCSRTRSKSTRVTASAAKSLSLDDSSVCTSQ